MLLNKLGKLKASLAWCFLTREGEVRAWFSPDFKNNEQPLELQHSQPHNPLITSEVAMIKRILEFGEKLASNPT
jgi:hypothetical protein